MLKCANAHKGYDNIGVRSYHMHVLGLLFVDCPVQDFGDYADSYYAVQTTEGEQIAQLISGYIDIILKKVCDMDIEKLTYLANFQLPDNDIYSLNLYNVLMLYH